MTPRQKAGVKGAANTRQRQSRANYKDLEFTRDWMHNSQNPRAVRMVVMYQHWHRNSSAKARELLFRLIDG